MSDGDGKTDGGKTDGKPGGTGKGGGKTDGNGRRPNAGYSLSRDNGNPRPEEIVYHYSRERRLEKAPEAVRGLYREPEAPRRRGLFRFGAGGPGGRVQIFVMASILLVSVLALVATVAGRDDAVLLAGNRVAVQAGRYEELALVIVTVRKTHSGLRTGLRLRPAARPFYGPVNVEVTPYGAGPASVFFHRLDFTEATPEFFRFTVPFFDAERLTVTLRAGDAGVSTEITVE